MTSLWPGGDDDAEFVPDVHAIDHIRSLAAGNCNLQTELLAIFIFNK